MQLEKHLAQGKLLYLSSSHDAITVSENEHYRWLAFGQVVQSIMHKRKPWLLTLPHQTALLLPLLFFRPNSVVELGLGGGNLDRFLHHVSKQITLTSIEMNSNVIHCFEQFFNPEDTTISIIQNDGAIWLSSEQPDDFDWLICDVYKDEQEVFSHTITQLEKLTHHIDGHTCLSINLPDVTDDDINLALTVLQQLLPNHQLIYFHIPNYLNIIIHACPQSWRINSIVKHNKASYLPKRLYKRWRKFWLHGKKVC